MKKDLFINILSVFLFFVVWQICSSYGIVSDIFISSPVKILEKISEMFTSGMMNKHIYYSIYLLLISIVLSSVFGVIIGLIFYRFPLIYTFFKPLLFTLNSLPVLAVSPLIILWFGFESPSKILIMLIAALPPIIINTYSGAKNTDIHLLKMAESFQIPKASTLRQIVFFSSIPNIFSGLKIMIGRCIIGLVIADMFGYGIGIGYLLNFFSSTSDTTGLFAMTILLLFINLVLSIFLTFSKNLFTKKYHYQFE